jgi:DNA-binding GntR family transcriptional regulator
VLTSLTASGYFDHKRRPRPVGEDLADIYHWRVVLEREAFTIATPRLTSDDPEEMRRLYRRGRRRWEARERS